MKHRMDENQVMFSTEENFFSALPWIWCWGNWEFWNTAVKIVEIIFISYELLGNHIAFTASMFMSVKCKTKMKNQIYMHINVDIK
jgi:hypothetical protein